MKPANFAFAVLVLTVLSSCTQQRATYYHDCDTAEEYFDLGMRLKEQKRYEDAAMALKKAIRIHPEDSTEAKICQSIEAQIQIARIHLIKKEPETARKWTRASLKLASRRRDVIDWKAYLQKIKDLNMEISSTESVLARHARNWSYARWFILILSLVACGIFAAMYVAIKNSYKLLLANERRWAADVKPEGSSEGSDLYRRIVEHVESTKCYLEPSLRIDDIAMSVNSNRSYVSSVINENKPNFSTFINEYRVKEAIRMMTADKTLKVEYIASACGFGNRNSFTDAFKSITGFTPTKFRQEL